MDANVIKNLLQNSGLNEEAKFFPVTPLNQSTSPKPDIGSRNEEKKFSSVTLLDEGATPKLDIRTSIVPELNPS